jgi:hypothetical protein
MTAKKTAKSDATAMVPSSQFAESAKLERAITANLRGLGYGG